MNPYVESIRPAWEEESLSKYVSVDKRKLYELADELAKKDLITPDWRLGVFPEEDNEDFMRFLFVINCINYCFTNFKTDQKFDAEYPEGKIWEGSFAMAACVKRALDQGMPLLDPEFLRSIKEEDVRYIFRHKKTSIPMLSSRFNQLRQLGEDMRANGFTDFVQIFEKADFYVWRELDDSILKILENFDSYKHFRTFAFQSHTLKFQKRAQLLPMMYYGRAKSSNGVLRQIRDPEHIGPIFDYQVPRALRDPGVLVYSQGLADVIDIERREIKENSIAEIAIGAKTVLAMKELLDRVNILRPLTKKITMAELDYEIWRRGRNSKKPHHYVYTTGY